MIGTMQDTRGAVAAFTREIKACAVVAFVKGYSGTFDKQSFHRLGAVLAQKAHSLKGIVVMTGYQDVFFQILFVPGVGTVDNPSLGEGRIAAVKFLSGNDKRHFVTEIGKRQRGGASADACPDDKDSGMKPVLCHIAFFTERTCPEKGDAPARGDGAAIRACNVWELRRTPGRPQGLCANFKHSFKGGARWSRIQLWYGNGRGRTLPNLFQSVPQFGWRHFCHVRTSAEKQGIDLHTIRVLPFQAANKIALGADDNMRPRRSRTDKINDE